jgi:hypothetical protein
MKVSELKAVLAAYPDDMNVFVPFYEEGYTDPELEVKRIGPWKGVRSEWDGPYQDDDQAPPALIIG